MDKTEKLLVGIFGIGFGIGAVASIVTAVLLFGLVPAPASVGGGGTSVNTQACAVSTVANVQVGNQESKTILAATGKRAWARISQVQGAPGFASTTPFLSFDEGAAAVANAGVTLGTSTPSVDFGLATDFPYTGAVTGIVGNGGGTTTVQVVQCLYGN